MVANAFNSSTPETEAALRELEASLVYRETMSQKKKIL